MIIDPCEATSRHPILVGIQSDDQQLASLRLQEQHDAERISGPDINQC